MHGRKLVRKEDIPPEKLAAIQARVEKYKTASEQYRLLRRLGKLDLDLLPVLDKILPCNPELATIWNYRREIISEHFRTRIPFDSVARREFISKELAYNQYIIADVDFKSYVTWHHRRWVLSIAGHAASIHHPYRFDLQSTQVPSDADSAIAAEIPAAPATTHEAWVESILRMDLALCAEMLKADSRNFHCWGHSHWLRARLASLSPPRWDDGDELELARAHIGVNMSNYSAWHIRARRLAAMAESIDAEPALHTAGPAVFALSGSSRVPIDALVAEVDDVIAAAYVDDGDRAVWLYASWLLEVAVTHCSGGARSGLRLVLHAEVLLAVEVKRHSALFVASALVHILRSCTELDGCGGVFDSVIEEAGDDVFADAPSWVTALRDGERFDAVAARARVDELRDALIAMDPQRRALYEAQLAA